MNDKSMNVGELIEALSHFSATCPVCFSADLRSDEARPIFDVAGGEDDEGEIAVITSDDQI